MMTPSVVRLSTACWAFFILAWLPVASVAAEPPISQFQIRSFTEQCLPLLKQERFDRLVRLFHYPAEMDQAALKQEQSQIAASLAEFGKVFGTFAETTVPAQSQKLHQFEIQSASGSYWSARPRHFQIVYNTTFTQLGAGALVFRVVVYDHHLQLRSIGYAFSAETPGAEAKRNEVDHHMSRFFEQLQASSKE